MRTTGYTHNKLSVFDFAVGLSEHSVNEQIKSAWHIWGRQNKYDLSADNDYFQPTLSDKHVDSGALVDVHSETIVNVSGISISTNGDGLLLREVLVYVHISGGQINVEEVSKTDPAKRASREPVIIPEGKFKFRANLDREMVDPKDFMNIYYDEADMKEEIEARQKSDIAFSIELLFLNLTDAKYLTQDSGFLSPDGIPLQLDPNVKRSIGQILEKTFGQSNCKLLFGKVILPNNRNIEKDTFELSSFTMKRTPSIMVQSNNGRNTETTRTGSLDYLGVFEGREMPTSVDTAILAPDVSDSWLTFEELNGENAFSAGVAAFSAEKLLNKWLPEFKSIFNRPGNDQGKIYDREKRHVYWEQKYTWAEDPSAGNILKRFGIDKNDVQAKLSKAVLLKFDTKKNALRMEFQVHIDFDGYEHIGLRRFSVSGGMKNIYSCFWSIESNIEAGSIGYSLGSPTPLDVHADETIAGIEAKDTSSIGADIIKYAGILFGSNPVGESEALQAAIEYSYKAYFEKLKEKIEEEVNSFVGKSKEIFDTCKFYPSGRGVFEYGHPTVSPNGDLLFGINYKRVAERRPG